MARKRTVAEPTREERAEAYLSAEDKLRAAYAESDALIAAAWEANADARAALDRLRPAAQAVNDSLDRIAALRAKLWEFADTEDWLEHNNRTVPLREVTKTWIYGNTHALPRSPEDPHGC